MNKMAMWYLKHDNEEVGPIDTAELKTLARIGRLAPDDIIRRGDMGSWVRAEQVSGLFEKSDLSRTPPPLPNPIEESNRRTNFADAFTNRFNAVSQWYVQLPAPSKKKLHVSGICAVVAFIVLFTSWRSYVTRTPEYAFRMINGIHSSDDLRRCRPYITDQGYKVLTYAIKNQKGGPSSTDHKLVWHARQIRGNACYFPFSHGTNAGYMEFQQQGVWRFHDVVVTRQNGRDVELSMAYAIDHPILAALQTADWGAILDTFVKGFIIGYSLGGG
jgi:hypothetical protein